MQRWAAQRQMLFEGGFQGRTNKLVDGCYSFWVGALLPLISAVQKQESARRNISEISFTVDRSICN